MLKRPYTRQIYSSGQQKKLFFYLDPKLSRILDLIDLHPFHLFISSLILLHVKTRKFLYQFFNAPKEHKSRIQKTSITPFWDNGWA